ncbi:hypothetical protein pipiens_011862 [Culex pipiens pipiens]|uniref:Uncharacterized protein n=1 Tax=Culex pipiens pipiens TaxID=38569 RepID=A0ABD1D4M6_CULPP
MDGPKSLHLPLQDVNKIGGTGTEIDVNKPGIAIVYAPVNLTTGCKYVEMCQEALPEAVARNNVRNLSFKELRRGYISKGYTPLLDCHTIQIACEFSEIKKKVFRRSSKTRRAVARIAR